MVKNVHFLGIAQRTKDFKNGTYDLAGGVVDPLPDDAPQFVKDYYAHYKTPRGYHKRSLNSNAGWANSAGTSLLNTKLLAYADEIRSPVLVMHGEKAHSRYFSEGAFEKMTGKKAGVPAKLDVAKKLEQDCGQQGTPDYPQRLTRGPQRQPGKYSLRQVGRILHEEFEVKVQKMWQH